MPIIITLSDHKFMGYYSVIARKTTFKKTNLTLSQIDTGVLISP